MKITQKMKADIKKALKGEGAGSGNRADRLCSHCGINSISHWNKSGLCISCFKESKYKRNQVATAYKNPTISTEK